MSNTVTDPLTTGKIRNFRVDDGSGILVASGAPGDSSVVGPSASLLSTAATGVGNKGAEAGSAAASPGTGDHGMDHLLAEVLTAALAGMVLAAGMITKRKRA